jgi:hypothetical protein
MAVCYVCGKTLNQNVSARAVSAHIRECEKKNGKKKRFDYVPVEQRITKSSSSQQPDDIPADGPDLPGTSPPDDGPIIPHSEVLQPRRRRLPAKFIDHVISLPQFRNVSQLQAEDVDLEQRLSPETTPMSPQPESPQLVPAATRIVHDTTPNSFGVFRRYLGCFPSRDSDESQAIDYACNASTFDNVDHAENERQRAEDDQQQTTPQPDKKPLYYPFPNYTRYQLIHWFYRNHNKTVEDFQQLIDEILLSPDFKIEHLEGMDVKRELKRLDQAVIPPIMPMTSDTNDLFPPSEGWAESSVTIKLPPPNTRFKLKSEEDAPTVTIAGIHHRSLLEGITRAFTRRSFFDFHLKGFQLWWKPSDGEQAQRVHCEVYNSETFLEMEEQIPPLCAQDVQGGVKESMVAPIMLYSDATHLANFGAASLWPIYMYIGLLSQYIRSKKSSFAAFHLAYLASVCITLFHFFKSD